MLDFLTRRRLIFCLIAFLIVTISLLFLTQLNATVMRHFAPFYSQLSSINISNDNNDQQISTCYLKESVTILTPCQKCTSYERRSQAFSCSPSGYRESVECSTSKIKTSRSCPIPMEIQKRHFWFFEGTIFIIGLFAVLSVHSRQKTLDKQMVDKIKRQIGENEE